MHYIVRSYNSNSAYGTPTEDGYFTKLATAFKILNANYSSTDSGKVYVDAANGIGGLALKKLLTYMGDDLDVCIVNFDEGPLNEAVLYSII